MKTTLKQYRIKNRKSQLEMAKDLGVSKNTYYNWECGANEPNDINKQVIKDVLGLEV